MGRFYPVLLAGSVVLFMVYTKAPVFGKEVYETPSSEVKVKDTMKTLQEGLDNLEEAVLKDDMPMAVKLAREVDEASHYICKLNLSNSELSKKEQQEFVKLREDMHKRIDIMAVAVEKGLPDVVIEESYKVRESCENCHKVFKKK